MLDDLLKSQSQFFSNPFLATLYLFFLGLKNSFNPCALATVLVIQLFIRKFAYNRRMVLRLGFIAIVSVFLNYILLAVGYWDKFLEKAIAHNMFYKSYLTLAVIFLIVGIIHFVDWVRYLKKNDLNCFLIRVPRFITDRDSLQPILSRTDPFKKVALYIAAFYLGVALAVLASIWPQDPELYVSSYFMVTSGKSLGISLMFAFYSLGYVFLLIIIWVSVFYVTRSQKRKEKVLQHISLIKIVFSSVFLSVGAGLMYFFLS